METITVRQAKTSLSRLISMVSRGMEFIITKSGNPVARLIPYSIKKEPRKLGQLRGKIHISENFDRSLPLSYLAAFEGKIRPPRAPK